MRVLLHRFSIITYEIEFLFSRFNLSLHNWMWCKFNELHHTLNSRAQPWVLKSSFLKLLCRPTNNQCWPLPVVFSSTSDKKTCHHSSTSLTSRIFHAKWHLSKSDKEKMMPLHAFFRCLLLCDNLIQFILRPPARIVNGIQWQGGSKPIWKSHFWFILQLPFLKLIYKFFLLLETTWVKNNTANMFTI